MAQCCSSSYQSFLSQKPNSITDSSLHTTVGYGNFLLPDGWHMLAPIIAMSGLFTFGWTGSVLVEVVRRCQEVKTAAYRAKLEHGKHAPPPH